MTTSGPQWPSCSAEHAGYNLLYGWHSVHIQTITCLLASQSPGGYTHSNTVLCLYPSPQALKLYVWCGAPGSRVITSVKQTAQGETRPSALEGVVNDELQFGDKVRKGSLALAHRNPVENTLSCLNYITDHMIADWFVTNGKMWTPCEGSCMGVERERASDGQLLLEIALIYCRHPY